MARRLSSLSEVLRSTLHAPTIDQFNGAVVLEAEPVGRIGDGDGCSFGSARNLKKKLVLLRL